MNRASSALVVLALSVAFRASSAAAAAATFSAPPTIGPPPVGAAAVGALGEAAPAPSDLWYEHFDASPLGVRPDLSWFAGDVSDWGVWTEYAPDCGVEITPGRSMRIWAYPHGTSGTQPSVANPLLTVGGSPVVLSEGLRFLFTATSASEWNPDGSNYGGAYARFYAGPASDPLQGAGIYYIVDGHGSFPAYPVLDPYALIDVGSSGRFYCDLWQDFRDLVGYSPTGWVLWNLEILVSGGRYDTSVEVVFDDLVLTTGGIFVDVPVSFWACDEIEACAQEGVVSGYADGTYQPGLAVTRDQMAVYIARAVAGGDDNVPEFSGTPTFPDVTEGSWALNYVEYAVDQSVVAGYDDGNYHPEYEVTRDQMAVYVARALVAPSGEAGLADYTPSDPRNFPDVPSDFWSYKHIEYCVENGVVSGYEDGLYHPEVTVTRDQMAV
jgi:hypothetical protein